MSALLLTVVTSVKKREETLRHLAAKIAKQP